MCFSANASFAAAGIITFIGILTLKNIKNKRQIPFAIIPLLFAIQQFIEGISWLALNGTINSEIIKFSSYGFLFFALILWPFWLPFSVIILENNKKRKKILFLTLLTGSIVSAYSVYCLIVFGVTTKVISHHIFYDVKMPVLIGPDFAAYLIATILPFFISSIKLMYFFGLMILLSLALTYLLYTTYLISVWCFFAAILSVLIYLITIKQK